MNFGTPAFGGHARKIVRSRAGVAAVRYGCGDGSQAPGSRPSLAVAWAVDDTWNATRKLNGFT